VPIIDSPAESRLARDHPLAGCQAKLWRAHENFELLQEQIKTWTEKVEGATFRPESKPHTKDTLWTCVDTVVEPPLYIATTIGDVVHNLRSALDHLVFELAFLGLRGKRIPERTAFPCSETNANWNSTYVQDILLEGVLKKHRAMLYRAQPCYRRKDTTNPDTLRRRRRRPAADLNNLWKEDKHRMIQAVAVSPYEIKPRVGGFRDCRPTGPPRICLDFLGRPLKVDADVLEVPIEVTGPEPQVNVEIEIACEVGFRNGLPVRKALADIGGWVGAIIERFAREFETPLARRLWGLPRGSWIDAEPLRRGRTYVGEWTLTHDPPPPRGSSDADPG
jgi:hypothetical protein